MMNNEKCTTVLIAQVVCCQKPAVNRVRCSVFGGVFLFSISAPSLRQCGPTFWSRKILIRYLLNSKRDGGTPREWEIEVGTTKMIKK